MSSSSLYHLAAVCDSILKSKFSVGSTVSYVKNEFTHAELVLVNFETPIADRVKPRQKAAVFRVRTEEVDRLHSSGFTIAGIANNHIYDYGHLGLQETVMHLNSSGLGYVGREFGAKAH